MTHGSLFSGIGGFDLGAERAGLQNLWACEIDEFKQAILRKHFPDTQIYSDIKTINPPYVDVISGGLPMPRHFAITRQIQKQQIWKLWN